MSGQRSSCEKEIAPGFLLSSALKAVANKPVYKHETKRYSEQYLSNQEENALPWLEFISRLPVLHAEELRTTKLALVLVSKSVTWSGRDVSVYVGKDGRRVSSILDFEKDEFIEVLQWHAQTAIELSKATSEPIYVTHGFNPEDTAPDAHSLREKFHTHIYIPDKANKPVKIKDLNWFEKLSFIEPFSEVFADFTEHYFETRNILSPWDIIRSPGFFTLELPLDKIDSRLWNELYLYIRAINLTFNQIEAIFTDKSVESETGFTRYIARPYREILESLEKYFTEQDWFSENSTYLLRYLSRNLINAEQRIPKRTRTIEAASQLWLAKGLSAAINLVFDVEQNALQIQFAPRIISTSGATKVLAPNPTLIVKDQGYADKEELERMRHFESTLIQIALRLSDVDS